MKEYTREEMDQMYRAMNGESAWDRMKRKSREEPLVPAGKNRNKKVLYSFYIYEINICCFINSKVGYLFIYFTFHEYNTIKK